jgi:hypothetical protein
VAEPLRIVKTAVADWARRSACFARNVASHEPAGAAAVNSSVPDHRGAEIGLEGVEGAGVVGDVWLPPPHAVSRNARTATTV